MAHSDYLQNQLLNHVYGGPDFVRPATIYFALFTTMPTSVGGGVEVTGGSYVRVAVTNDNTNFPVSATESKSSAFDIVFPESSAHWGTVLGLATFDASSGGNMLDFGLLTTPVVIPIFTISRFNSGDLAFTLTCP